MTITFIKISDLIYYRDRGQMIVLSPQIGLISGELHFFENTIANIMTVLQVTDLSGELVGVIFYAEKAT